MLWIKIAIKNMAEKRLKFMAFFRHIFHCEKTPWRFLKMTLTANLNIEKLNNDT
jgi:hypothetical protein